MIKADGNTTSTEKGRMLPCFRFHGYVSLTKPFFPLGRINRALFNPILI